MLFGLDAAERERVAALRGEGRFFWLDVSLGETSRDDLVDALGIPERALRALASSGDASASRTFHADRESVVFALRCYIESEAPAEEAAYRLRPVEVHVLVTGDYLLTLHEERISLPQSSLPSCRRNGASRTSSTRCSRRCSRRPPTSWRRSSEGWTPSASRGPRRAAGA